MKPLNNPFLSKSFLQMCVKDQTGQAETIDSELCRGNCILSVLIAVVGVARGKALLCLRTQQETSLLEGKKLSSK